MILRTNTMISNKNFSTVSTLLLDTEKIVLSSTGIESRNNSDRSITIRTKSREVNGETFWWPPYLMWEEQIA